MSLLAYSLITIIQKLFWLVDILILIRVLLSWFPMNNNFTITELLMLIPVILTIWSGWEYTFKAKHYFAEQ